MSNFLSCIQSSQNVNCSWNLTGIVNLWQRSMTAEYEYIWRGRQKKYRTQCDYEKNKNKKG